MAIFTTSRYELAASHTDARANAMFSTNQTARNWNFTNATGADSSLKPRSRKEDPTMMDVTLDQAACELLFKMLQPATPEDDEYSEVRLQWGDGHSGRGLYVSMTDYPEEGSVLLVEDRTLEAS
jgi:hypothetical protein